MDSRQKQSLFQQITNTGFFGRLVQNDLFLAFINSFKDLKSMKSTDGRPQFNNAEDDIRQHYIMNDDMSLDDVFSSKVGIYKDDVTFKDFLMAVLDARFSENEAEVSALIDIINPFLHADGEEVFLYGYNNNGQAVYRIKKVEEEYSPKDLAVNRISFFVDKYPTGNTKYAHNHTKPEKFPSFVLAFNRGWDDFGVSTWFDLFYYDENETPHHIGVVKIIHTSYNTQDQGLYYVSDYIDDSFTQLSSDYCSLGQSEDYYFTLRRLLPDDYLSVLWALRDCALFPMVEEKFSNHPHFYSLIRETGVEDVLNNVMYRLKDESAATRFYFKYHFQPKYADYPSDVEFKFSSKGEFPNNLYAIIGRNGVGKTQLISQLPLDLEANRLDAFNHKPSFKKYITVSYCYYDNFRIPDTSATFDYRYCGLLKKLPDGHKEIMTKEDLQNRLVKDCKEITKKGRVDEWAKVMRTFFPDEVIDSWREGDEKKHLNIKAIVASAEKLSSGEASFLYVFFDIMAHIRRYSLILFDEPETHLHPTAITSMINAVHRLLKTYNSYGLIVTHSPIIIRELLSRNVLVMQRNANQLSTYKIGIESFGENVSVLTSEVFGSEDIKPYYKRQIKELAELGAKYDEIVKEIQTEGIPLGLNLQMFVKNLTKANGDEES